MDYLIENGVDVDDIEGDQRRTALFAAITSGNGDMAKLLIKAGADVNFKVKSIMHS